MGKQIKNKIIANDNTIKCPNCDAEINVSDILYHQVENQLKRDFEKKLKQQEEKLQEEMDTLKIERENLKKDKLNLTGLVDNQLQIRLKTEKEKIENTLRAQINDENNDMIKTLKEQLDEKSSQVKDFKKKEVEIEKLKREKNELRENIELEKEKEFTQILNEEKKKIKLQVDESNNLIIKDLKRQLEEQKEIALEAVRNAEQGSMQRQGEIQELELENILRELHKYDEIIEIKKGQQGADIVQNIKNENGIVCGKIYYESKRTKSYNDGWLQKLRDDNLTVKADLLVLVTETMPNGHDKYFYKDGVWICSLGEAKGLSTVLRFTLIQVHSVYIKQQGKGSKMEMLYNYLTSQEFSGQFGAIIEGFKSLQDNYADEKIKMQKLWKEREKQLEKILTNTIDFYGSIKGIAGASIQDIKILEDGNQIKELPI